MEKLTAKARKVGKKDKLPLFVRMGDESRSTCLRRRGVENFEYWRDGGEWGVGVRFVGNQLITWDPDPNFKQLHRKPLTEVTYEVWRKDNEPYGDHVKDPNLVDEDDDNEVDNLLPF